MSPAQPKGFNWTILAIGLSTASTLVYVGKSTGRIETKIENIEYQNAQKNAKDNMQDMFMFDVNGRVVTLETMMEAVKEGRYDNKIERSSKPSPVFGAQ